MAEEPFDQIHAALARDSVYVHPQLRDQFSAGQLDDIRANIAEHDEPLFVVAWPMRDNDQFSGNTADLLTRLHDAHPVDGVYLATTTRLTDDLVGIDLEGRQWGTAAGDGELSPYQLLATVRYAEHPTLGDAFVHATELLNQPASEVEAAYEAAQAAYREEHPVDTGGGPIDDGGLPGGVVGGLVAVVVVAVVLLVGRRMLGRGRRGDEPTTTYVLPPSAMARIRHAHDRRLEEQARAAVLVLGEAIDREEITERQDASAWQAALDHYDAARAILRDVDQPDVLDVVGAIVLADNGDRALSAARDGVGFEEPARCFLNPLHGTAAAQRSVQIEDRRVEVPLCEDCRSDLAGKRTPDMLDVVRGGRPVHYFETDAEPWASTGFGSLDPGLVRHLHGGT